MMDKSKPTRLITLMKWANSVEVTAHQNAHKEKQMISIGHMYY